MAKKHSKIVKKKTGFSSQTITIVYTLLFIFGVGITAFFVSTKQSNQQVNRNTIITPTPTPNDFLITKINSGSKYTDLKEHYSIEYPVNWTSIRACQGGIQDDCYLSIKSPNLRTDPIPRVLEGQLITIGPRFAGNPSLYDDFCKIDGMTKLKECTKFQLNGNSAIKKIWENFPFIDVAILKNNEIKFVIRLEYAWELLYTSHEFAEFDTIVSSFKLIE